jgi:hypothetical protein
MKPSDKDLARYAGVEATTVEQDLGENINLFYDEYNKTLNYLVEQKAISLGRSPTDEEITQIRMDLDTELSKGIPTKYGSSLTSATLPLETQTPSYTPPTLGQAVGRQQTVGQMRTSMVDQTTYAPEENLENITEQKLIEVYTKARTPDAGVLSPEELDRLEFEARTDADSLVYAYRQLAKTYPYMTPEQRYEEVLNALQTMDQVPTVRESALDPKMKAKFKGDSWYDKLAQALEGNIQEGNFKAYSPTQGHILSYQIKEKINSKVLDLESRMGKEPADLVKVQTDGEGTILMPREVFEYIGEDGLGTIFTNEKDLAIRKVYKGESGQYYGLIGFSDKTLDQAPQRADHKLALAKVRAYQQEDYDWTVDPERRDFIIDHLDDYKNEGWFQTTTALGGVAETGTSWFLRNAFLFPNVLTGAVIRGAKDVADIGIELATGEEDVLRQATLEERQKNAPLFAEDSFFSDLTDSIARNKGFLDEQEVLTTAFDIQDPVAKGALTVGLFAMDFLNPDLDLISGTVKGAQKAGRMVQANRKLYGSGGVDDFFAPKTYNLTLDEFAKGLSDEVLDDMNLISITNNTIKKVKGTPVDNLVHGDIRLRMGEQVANNLEAKRLLELGRQDELVELGLDKTPYYQQVQKVGKEQADEFAFGSIRRNEVASDLYNEYLSAQRFIDDVETTGYDNALRRAKNDPNFNQKTIDNIVKTESPLEIEQIIPRVRRGLNSVYGRGIMFEMAPEIRDLEAIVELTPRLYAGKKVAEELRFVASQSDIGQRLGRLSQLPFGEDIKPAQVASTELFGAPLVKEGRRTKFFDLSRLTQDNRVQLINDLDALDLSNTERMRIADSIENNKIYSDDLNKIVDLNTERALLTDGRVATLDDINRLANQEQQKLLEAADTAARKAKTNFIGSTIRTAFDKMSNKVFKSKGRQTLAKVMEPQVKVRKSLGIRANRILRKIDGQIGNLELRAEREYRRLIDNGLEAEEALAQMIIGDPQDLIGNFSKRNNIGDAILWMTDQMFTHVDTKIAKSTSSEDIVSGFDKLLANDVFSHIGILYRNKLVDDFVEDLIDNPKNFWQNYQDLIQELSRLLKDPNGRVSYMDDSGDLIEGLVRNVAYEADAIILGKGVPLETIMPEISLGAYMATEIRRITKEVIVDDIDESLVQISAVNVFPDLNIVQEQYADLLRYTTEIMYTNRGNPFNKILDAIKAGIRKELGDVVSESQMDNVARTMYDQSETVLRNNRLLNSETYFTAQELGTRLDQLFGPENETLFKALIGESLFKQMKDVVDQRGYGFVQQEITKVLKENPTFYDTVGFIQNVLKAAFYTGVLGMRIAYHMVNTVTAPALIYQTIGSSKLFRDTDLVGLGKRAWFTVTQGSNKGSRMYADVALRTQDGRVYTYGDLFEALQKTGAKTEYTYIKSALRDGTLLKDIRLATMGRGGIGGTAKLILQNIFRGLGKAGDALTGFATAQDMMFRSAVLVNALKDGRSLDESAKLASRSLFDYNDMPDVLRKYTNGAFVFTSFAWANNVDLLRAFMGLDANALKRYMYVAKVTRDTNKFYQYMNDNQEYPYEMYFPEFAQPRLRFGYQQDPDGRNASFKMGMSIPSNEAIQFHLSVIDSLYRREYSDVRDYALNMLDPSIKIASDIFLDTNLTRLGNKVPLKHVQVFGFYGTTPSEIAQGIEQYTGTQVYPRFVGFNATGNYNGYLYEFKDKKQKRVYLTNWRVVAATYGADSLLNAYIRPLDPQGSSYMGQSPAERLGGALGFYSPVRMKTPTQQQILAIGKHISQLRKIGNRAEQMAMDEAYAPKEKPEDTDED